MPNEIITPLDDMELDDLGIFLDSLPDAMSLEKTDGFLAALACSHEMVLPSDYLPSIWGTEHAWENEADAKKYVSYIVRHWNHLLSVLREDDFYEILLNEPEGNSAGNEWSLGFTLGMSITSEKWRFYLDDDNEGGVFLPIFMLAHENDPDPELRPPSIDKQQRNELLGSICAYTPKIFKHMSQSHPSVIQDDFDDDYAYEPPLTFRREGPKVGRNAPCPCGSGKKYKKCCGRN